MSLVRSPFDAAVNELRIRVRTALAALDPLKDGEPARSLALARADELRRLSDLILAAGDLPRNPNQDSLDLHQVVVEAKALFTGREAATLQDVAWHELAVEEALGILAAAATGPDDQIDVAAARRLASEIAATSRRIRAFAETKPA